MTLQIWLNCSIHERDDLTGAIHSAAVDAVVPQARERVMRDRNNLQSPDRLAQEVVAPRSGNKKAARQSGHGQNAAAAEAVVLAE
jgi:hypothetical protein